MGFSKDKTMHIGWDLDDVTTNLTEELLRIYNERTGACASVEDVKDWSFFPPQIHLEMMSSGYSRLKAKPGSTRALSALKDSGDKISIITYRDPDCRGQTLRWLEANIPGLYDNLYMTGGPKSGVCGEIGIDVLVDDSKAQALGVSACGIHAVLFSTPMNRGAANHDFIHRADGYENVLQIIEMLRKELKG